MGLEPSDITWIVAREAGQVFSELYELLGAERYRQQKRDLQELLCGYFDAAPGCTAAQGNAIRPTGGSAAGGKGLKVRWGWPGCGKSGGMRICAVAYCDARRVYILDAEMRRDRPDFDDIITKHKP